MFGQIVPDVLVRDQAVLHGHAVDEADALKALAIWPSALQRAMAKHHGGIALPAFFKMRLMLGDAVVALLGPGGHLLQRVHHHTTGKTHAKVGVQNRLRGSQIARLQGLQKRLHHA